MKAKKYFHYQSLSRGFAKLKLLPGYSRELLRAERMKRRVISYYNQLLLRKTFHNLKKYSQQVSKTKYRKSSSHLISTTSSLIFSLRQLEQEHQMRRNKIQSFITKIKHVKGPPSATTQPQVNSSFSCDQDSLVSVSSFNPPPSYCSAEESPHSPEPFPQSLDLDPELHPTFHLNQSSSPPPSFSSSSSSMERNISSNRSRDRVVERNSKEKRQQPMKSSVVAAVDPTRKRRESSQIEKSPRNGLISRLPTDQTEPRVGAPRSKSAPRGTARPPRPPNQTQSQAPDVTPALRREKMKTLEEAAKARVQSKKERESEMKRSSFVSFPSCLDHQPSLSFFSVS
jgi:molecular chaperone DnaK (HSP70)